MACGSDFVVQDIVDAVEFMKKIVHVDTSRIYLCGGSGGGYAALLMAGRHPEIWKAVSCWCPIYNLTQWHKETRESESWERYARDIERVCGGDPGKDPLVFQEAEYRSASAYLKHASSVPLDICTGIHDGHTGSVPVSHAIQAYNTLAAPADRIAGEDIQFILENEKIPEHLKCLAPDPAFGEHTVLLRRQSANVRLTLFEGAHDILPAISADWLSRQIPGKMPDWGNGQPFSEEAVPLTH